MGVYIKAMEMPSECDFCKLENNGYCRALSSSIRVEEGIDPRCPLIEDEAPLRCKECKYLAVETDDDGTPWYYCTPNGHEIDETDFCSWGKREESE